MDEYGEDRGIAFNNADRRFSFSSLEEVMTEVKVRGAKLLNKRKGWFDLSIVDLIGLGYLLIILNFILKRWELELLSFPLTGIAFFILLSIRLKSRPKTIRDFLRSKTQIGRIRYYCIQAKSKKNRQGGS